MIHVPPRVAYPVSAIGIDKAPWEVSSLQDFTRPVNVPNNLRRVSDLVAHSSAGFIDGQLLFPIIISECIYMRNCPSDGSHSVMTY